jgi:hypothetical protein
MRHRLRLPQLPPEQLPGGWISKNQVASLSIDLPKQQEELDERLPFVREEEPKTGDDVGRSDLVHGFSVSPDLGLL